MPVALRLLMALVALLLLPGGAILAASGGWRRWPGLQGWILAVGLSIAFYPALMYGLRAYVPFVTLGPYKLTTLLVLCALLVGWRLKGVRQQLRLQGLEWVALVVFGVTLFTRYRVALQHPYPAWTDSLHHVLLTQLTAVQGELPNSLAPYFPIPLDQYHLGLYALAAPLQWLAQVPAHTALLWTAQTLNGLCGLGVYLVLERNLGGKGGRAGAIVAAVAVGLVFHQPAYYVNWGRFTQIAGQALLLIAWVAVWDAMVIWRLPWHANRRRIVGQTLLAGLLTGSVFLLHFRVAVFYLLLLAITAFWTLWLSYRRRHLRAWGSSLAAVGAASLLVVVPVFWPAWQVYMAQSTQATAVAEQSAAAIATAQKTVQIYFEFPWSSVPALVARPWLLWVAGLCAVVALLRHNRIALMALLWMAGLLLLGNAYRLGIPLLSVTNMGAILIMLYLPLGLLIGAGVQAAIEMVDHRWGRSRGKRVELLLVGIALAAGLFFGRDRMIQLEPQRFLVTDADLAAMTWIEQRTPADALFAVNTQFWLPEAPHGTDGGYWIPYFTGRKITAGSMLLNLAPQAYKNRIVSLSRAVEQLSVDNRALADLQRMGVEYIYVGRRNSADGAGLDASRLAQDESTELVYEQDGVTIFHLQPAHITQTEDD